MSIQNRGFASMNPDEQREIARMGGQASGGNFKNDTERASEAGKAAHANGKAHEFTSDEAREAGKKGGESRGSRE